MKPLRKNVALAVDGGGIKGLMVAVALMRLEKEVGKPIHELFNLAAGTSTGSLITAGIAAGFDAHRIRDLYKALGPGIFKKTWRTLPIIKLLVPYKYDNGPLIAHLRQHLGEITLGELHQQKPDFHMVITATDVYAIETRFIKLHKSRYADWKLWEAALASSTVPAVFPPFLHHFKKMPDDPSDQGWIPEMRYWVDGGMGSYCNPCFMAAYEIAFCLSKQGWSLDNTTLISIGTGRNPLHQVWKKWLGKRRGPTAMFGPEWAFPAIETFLHDANEQQVRLTKHFFADAIKKGLDFRRFNIAYAKPITLDQVDSIQELERYGEKMGEMIVNDETDDVGEFGCGGSQTFTPLKGGKR